MCDSVYDEDGEGLLVSEFEAFESKLSWKLSYLVPVLTKRDGLQTMHVHCLLRVKLWNCA